MMNIVHAIYNYLHLFYIAFTESLFVQLFGIFVFYVMSRYLYAPTKNWYYPEDEHSQRKETL